MKPKTIDEILMKINDYYDDESYPIHYFEEAKQQLLDLFMSCVPSIKEDDRDTTEPLEYESAWNDCRDQMIKNLEKLK